MKAYGTILNKNYDFYLALDFLAHVYVNRRIFPLLIVKIYFNNTNIELN